MNVAILTVSDRSAAGDRDDVSGLLIKERIEAQGWQVLFYSVVPDEESEIEKFLIQWCDSGEVDLILTTGGTGFSPRDITPESTRSVIERDVPGIPEVLRQEGLKKTAHAMLSRAVAGIRGKTLIINLPGNPKAVKESLPVLLPVLPHAIKLLTGDPDAHELPRNFPTT
jgi:molybdenum cofactor synthesis domain-containing protein